MTPESHAHASRRAMRTPRARLSCKPLIYKGKMAVGAMRAPLNVARDVPYRNPLIFHDSPCARLPPTPPRRPQGPLGAGQGLPDLSLKPSLTGSRLALIVARASIINSKRREPNGEDVEAVAACPRHPQREAGSEDRRPALFDLGAPAVAAASPGAGWWSLRGPRLQGSDSRRDDAVRRPHRRDQGWRREAGLDQRHGKVRQLPYSQDPAGARRAVAADLATGRRMSWGEGRKSVATGDIHHGGSHCRVFFTRPEISGPGIGYFCQILNFQNWRETAANACSHCISPRRKCLSFCAGIEVLESVVFPAESVFQNRVPQVIRCRWNRHPSHFAAPCNRRD